ncbi:MAG TPA: CHC2 zinc finger domain-containing protein, partial [Solirubrobacteraceae bacterium]|nr:CHC2 zinc finger domain-containing protein [Solirubrobacteraceae bacterium]
PRALRELVGYLLMLFGRERGGSLINIRYRDMDDPRVMHDRWVPANQPAAAAREILALGQRSDTYVGVAPRRHRRGGKAAITHAWAVWADCDTPHAVRALRAFSPAANIIIASGSADNCHAYWTLSEPIGIAELEHANTRLAERLRACHSAVTNAATILRPPGTQNFKHNPPTPVRVAQLQRRSLAPAEILGVLPRRVSAAPRRPRHPAVRAGDPLLRIDPRHYVQRLTGRTPDRAGKSACPIHQDDTPSLHAYPTPARGWYCYGCKRGGSIYELAAALWNLDVSAPAYRDFPETQRRLDELFAIRR